MASQTTFYFSQFLNRKFFSPSGEPLGVIRDFMVDIRAWASDAPGAQRPGILAMKIRQGPVTRVVGFTGFTIRKYKGKLNLISNEVRDLSEAGQSHGL